MKAYNKLSAVLLLSAGAFCHQALADNAVFTAMDDPSTAKKPFEGSVVHVTTSTRMTTCLDRRAGYAIVSMVTIHATC